MVTMMQQKDFKDWEILSKQTTKRKASINFSKCVYFRFSQSYRHGYGCGDSYSNYLENSDIKVSMVKGRGKSTDINFDLSKFQIPQKYISPIPLSTEKKADLQVLINDWVPPAIKRQYWDRVLSSQGCASDNADST